MEDTEMRVRSGRELREELVRTNDVEKVMRILREDSLRKQEEIFFINKRLMELATYFNQMTDTLSNMVQGMNAMSAEVLPLVRGGKGVSKAVTNNISNTEQ